MTMSNRRRPEFLSALLILASIVAVSTGHGQEVRRFFSKGSVELGGSVSYSAVQPVINGKNGDVVNLFSVTPYVGYFVLDGFEIGVNPLGIAVRDSAGSTTTDLRMFLAPSYNFRTPSIATPFVEGLAGFTFRRVGSTNWNGFSWGGRAGIKVAVTDKGLLNIGIQFVAVTLNTGSQVNRNGTNEFSVLVGWTVWL